jgi:hypothetical protein
MVFDSGPRAYAGPREYGEPQYTFFDRSGRPPFEAVRRRINDWYSHLCDGLKDGVFHRLCSEDDREFDAAFWELFLHELFTRLGYEISCEPTLPNNRKIDFLLRRGDAAFYLEATTAGKADEQRGADARRDRIYRELNKVRTTAFMLGITIDQAGRSDPPGLARLRDELDAWRARLDPDEVLNQWDANGEVPSYYWSDDGGWALILEALPNKPELREQPVDRPLGIFLEDTAGIVRDEIPLMRALKRKQPSRYGDLPLPYVVAVGETSVLPFDPTPHRTNVMFGSLKVVYGDDPAQRWVRTGDGIWRGPGAHPQNRRLAAVLFASNLTPWAIDQVELEWWDNPFANHPVPKEVLPNIATRRQLLPDQTGGRTLHATPPVRTPGSVLNLDT